MKRYYIRVKTEEQLRLVQKWGKADFLIVDGMIESCVSGDRSKVIFSLPDIARQAKIESIEKMYKACCGAGGIMIKNLDELGLLTENGYEGRVIADSFLYAYNSEAAEFYLSYYPKMQFVCSDELTDREMQQTVDVLAAKDKFIYKIYGYQQLMITNQCVSRNYTGCSDKLMWLKDDKGNEFVTQSNCSQCYSILYNGSKSYMLDKPAEISFENRMVDFTIENAKETEEVLKELDLFIREDEDKGQNKAASDKKTGITRGHHYKGVD